MGSIRCDRRLWLTADRSEIVEQGDPRARFLLGSEGRILPGDVVGKYELERKNGRVTWPGMKQAAKPEDKMSAAPENKAAPEPEEGPPADEWDLDISPANYLDRWPDGPNAELARRLLEE